MVGVETFGVKLKARCPRRLPTDLKKPVHVLRARQKEPQEAHALVLAGLGHAQEDQVDT